MVSLPRLPIDVLLLRLRCVFVCGVDAEPLYNRE